MKIDAYSILIALSICVVVSYLYNYLARVLKIPSVLLLIATGVGLRIAADSLQIQIPQTRVLLEILGVAGLIFIVLEASLELHIEKSRLGLIGRALLSALGLLTVTSLTIAVMFTYYYDVDFNRAMLHAIPLSVISSAIAIPSVSQLEPQKKEFVVYESTFSDILGIIAFNIFLSDHDSGFQALAGFGTDLLLILLISTVSTLALVFLLNRITSEARFFLAFAIIILTYSVAKFWHLPSLILVLCFGLFLNNVGHLNFPLIQRHLSLVRLTVASRELKAMTAETAFIIRTFFFLMFGYTVDLSLLATQEVIITGLGLILITGILRFVFLKYLLGVKSTLLALIAPRGLITILLFFSIPEEKRLEALSEGVLFIVIGLTALMMAIGLMINKEQPSEAAEDVI